MFLLFLCLIVVLMPFHKMLPNRKLHKLLVVLRGTSLRTSQEDKKTLLPQVLALAGNMYMLFSIRIKNDTYTLYKNKLVRAGLQERVTVESFFGLKILLALVFFLYLLMYFLFNLNLKAAVLLLLGPFVAYGVPDNVLNKKIRERQGQLQAELPSILNTLAVITDAGLSLTEAIKKVCTVRQGVLVTELKKVLEDLNVGFLQRDAFNRMVERCQVPEISVFVFTLNQSIEKGTTGVAQTLKEQAQEIWEQRKIHAKELGEKASVKLFFPMLLLVFPCLLIFLLGPVIFSLIQIFAK